MKPTVLYPTVTPKLFEVSEKKQDSYKILYTKRNKYNSLRMANANTVYTNYIRNNLEQLSFMRPEGKNIKLEKKTEL